MTRLEARLRRDLQAQAEHITPLSVPPLRLDRFTRDPRERAGMTRPVTRRLALCSAAGVAVALSAGAVVWAATGVPGARHDSAGRPAVDTAYVVKRVDSALGAAGPGEIAQMTVTTRGDLVPGGATTAEEWSYGGQWHSVIYSSAGHLDYDEGFSTSSSVYTLVSYPARTWARGPGLAPSPAVLAGTGGCRSPLPAGVVRALRAAVSCLNLRAAGRQRVEGVEAIELTGRDSKISATIWVSPGTYLPVRVVIRPDPGKSGPGQEADISWLAPTAQNRARLTVAIPAGFRQVPLTQSVGPVPKDPRTPLPTSR
jgi:Predicted periplasmic protein (DUF2092)